KQRSTGLVSTMSPMDEKRSTSTFMGSAKLHHAALAAEPFAPEQHLCAAQYRHHKAQSKLCTAVPMFIDTHAHLDHKQFESDREAMLQRALDAGVTKLFLPNIDADSEAGMHALANAHPTRCFPMMGLHP